MPNNTKLRAGTRENGDVYFYERNHSEDSDTIPFNSLELDLDGVPVSFRIKGDTLILEKVKNGEKKSFVSFNISRVR